MLRTGSKGLAAATLLLDMAKGTAAVLLADRLLPGNAQAMPSSRRSAPWSAISIRSGCSFAGGKGVATLFGIVLAFAILGELHWPRPPSLPRSGSACWR